MQKEIGSEFWLEREPSTLVHDRDGCYVLSGRTAIDLIIQDIVKTRPLHNVYMPAWGCDSMVEPFLARGITVELYDISYDKELQYHIDAKKQTDIFYVSNYFGYETTIETDIIHCFKAKSAIILYDRTHSLLMEDDPCLDLADYSFTSIRKWMGVLAGALVNGVKDYQLNTYPYLECKEKAMQMKKAFIEGDESIDKLSFLNLYSEFGHHLAEDYKNYEMDDLSYALYKSENMDIVRRKRRENAKYLHAHLNQTTLAPLTDKTVPLFVPIFFETTDRRNSVRKKLIDAQIYCPIHWPKNRLVTPTMWVNSIFDKELSLICDQRYGIAEMQRIIEIIQ